MAKEHFQYCHHHKYVGIELFSKRKLEYIQKTMEKLIIFVKSSWCKLGLRIPDEQKALHLSVLICNI